MICVVLVILRLSAGLGYGILTAFHVGCTPCNDYYLSATGAQKAVIASNEIAQIHKSK